MNTQRNPNFPSTRATRVRALLTIATLALLVSGCVQSPALPGGAPSKSSSVQAQPFAWDGKTFTMVCVPDPVQGECLAPFIRFAHNSEKLNPNGTVIAFDANLTWTPITPVSQTLQVRIHCEGERASMCAGVNEDSFEGPSPLVIRLADLQINEDAKLSMEVRGVNLTAPTGQHSEIDDGTPFHVEGILRVLVGP